MSDSYPMQLESEALYKRAAAGPDNRARIRKLYNLVYGRDPKEPEILAGLEYLKTEPLKEYEEAKNEAQNPVKDPPAEGDKADAKSETGAAKAEVAQAKTDGVEAEVDAQARVRLRALRGKLLVGWYACGGRRSHRRSQRCHGDGNDGRYARRSAETERN